MELGAYEHAYVTVDGVLLRYRTDTGRLQVYLIQRREEPERDKWSLPGGFVDIHERLDETLKRKFLVKTGIRDFYMEQLKSFDAIDRDPRARIISVAYLALTDRGGPADGWFDIVDGHQLTNGHEVVDLGDLAFDHGEILKEALNRMKGKIWYSDLLKHLLPEEFLIRDIQGLAETIEGRPILNFRRRIADKVTRTGHMDPNTNGRPAAIYRWNSGTREET